ncbi:formimidoylglutamase [Algibacter sp. 2305UL17-15]|uniref:formimidoylglutamase n=1 Tax=Algibacter sp. 2305UL17-15 TaxID=3231268 RepID=UPI00345A835C
MKTNSFLHKNVVYEPGQKKNWTGRKTAPNLSNQYWYQDIQCLNLNNIQDSITPNFGLVGYACDEGVKRNFGRVGAKYGPQSIRDALAKLPLHFKDKIVADYGDIICIEDDMKACQSSFSNSISALITQSVFPIGLGGGHDIAYAHYKGLKKNLKEKRIGIINFDAHFDLRPVETKPNSGTPFNQIITELKNEKQTLDYFVIGVQQQSNTRALFEIASKENVEFVFSDACDIAFEAIENIKQKLNPILEANDYLYITIDMDGFSSAYAKGVSAPSPLGFSPQFFFKILNHVLKTNKVIACDIAELNPEKDEDGQTANLAAKIIDYIIRSL